MIRRDPYGRKITTTASPTPTEDPPAPQENAATETGESTRPPAQPFRPVITTWRVTPPRPGGRLSERMATMFVVLALFGVLAAGGVWYMAHRPDAHYVRARDMVADYEIGRADDARNFGNAIYAGALTELRLVNPDSISAEPARDLMARIERETREFERRRKEEARERQAALEQQNNRQRAMQTARRRARVNPVTEYPECEHEEKGADHGH